MPETRLTSFPELSVYLRVRFLDLHWGPMTVQIIETFLRWFETFCFLFGPRFPNPSIHQEIKIWTRLMITQRCTVQILCIGTDRSQQTVQTKIRLLLKKQSDQGLRCLPFHQHILDALMQCCIKLLYFRTIMAIV